MFPEPHPDDRATGWLARALKAELTKGLDLFAICDADIFLYADLVVVHPDYGRTGLLLKFQELNDQIAKMEGAQAVVAIVFSQYASKAAAKNGHRIVRTLEYAEFQLADGSRPLKDVDLQGHHSISLVAYKLKTLKESHL